MKFTQNDAAKIRAAIKPARTAYKRAYSFTFEDGYTVSVVDSGAGSADDNLDAPDALKAQLVDLVIKSEHNK